MVSDIPKGRLLTGAMALGLCGQLILIWSLIFYGSYSFDRLLLTMFSLFVLGSILCIGYSSFYEGYALDSDKILSHASVQQAVVPLRIPDRAHLDCDQMPCPGVKVQIQSETSTRLVNIYLSSGEADQLIATIKTNSPHAHVERRQDKFYVDFCGSKESVR